jgi:hypothetical protein
VTSEHATFFKPSIIELLLIDTDDLRVERAIFLKQPKIVALLEDIDDSGVEKGTSLLSLA